MNSSCLPLFSGGFPLFFLLVIFGENSLTEIDTFNLAQGGVENWGKVEKASSLALE